MRYHHIDTLTMMDRTPFSLHWTRCLSAAAFLLASITVSNAQTASNNCGYNAGNEYPVGTSCTFSAFDKPGTFTNYASPAGCNGSTRDDAWGWFTATSNFTTITFDPDGNVDPIIHLFTGACAGLTVVACADANGNGGNETITYATAPGTNYMVRIQRYNSNTGMNGDLCIWSPPPPANDEPCGAVALTMNTSCTTSAGTTISATASAGIPAPGCASYSTADVWYSFVAPTSGVVNIETTEGTLTDNGVALYSATACAGTFTLIECDDNDGAGNMGEVLRTGLTAGDTYYIRVWGNGTASGTFDICVWTPPPPPANDEPCAAVALPVNTSCTASAGTTISATATAGIPATGCGTYAGGDVWYTFVAPSNGFANIQTTAGTLTDNAIALYSATACAGTFTLIECDDNDGAGDMGDIFRTGLTPGDTYYIRVWGKSGASGTFTICVWADPQPANDDPCGATALTVNTSCSTVAATTLGSTGTSGVPAPGCATYVTGDVWFSFVAPSTGVANIQTTAGTLTDNGVALYSATACAGTFTLIECDDNDGAGSMGDVLRTGLTPGTTYYVRVWGKSSASGTFNICVWAPPPPPANDEPCAAVALTMNGSCSSIAATNVSATSTAGIPAPGCSTYSGGDVWFSFVAPSTGATNIETTAGSMTNNAIALYSATACAGTFTLIECDDNDGAGSMGSIFRTGLTPGQTYYVRVWGNSGVTGTFNICTWYTIPPVNDDPCDAIALTPGSSCSFASYSTINGTATPAIPIPGCGAAPNTDVWFSIVAPANENFVLRITPGTMVDPAMALYSASACGGTFTLMECDDNDGPGAGAILSFSPGDLVAGETYYLRVWSGSGGTGTFNLCANTAPSTGDCFYVLRLYDSFDNGWGGSTVSIKVGAAAAVAYTITNGAQETYYIPFNNGDLIQVTYASVGGNQGQISYYLQLGAGILYNGGPTPATGLVFAAVGNCTPLAPPTSDCAGGTTLCSGVAFNGSPANTGIQADLNIANRGCLSSDERQGNWYHFSPSVSGTIAMTIAPTNVTDDYDFAIWGPFGSPACPPPSAPFRCSYSGTTGNTGLRAAASDLSEGAAGDKWVAPMTVLVGEVYSLYISNYSRSGLAFNLTWQLTNGASLDCNVLPVELLSFNGHADQEVVQLEWITASESGSSHYEVERSFDGYTFHTIGQVDAAGTSYTTLDYAFVDPQPLRGVNYYRLKQVDLDGTTDISDVVAVTFARGVSAGKPYPNPPATRINLDITLSTDAELTSQLMDATGRLVRSYRQGFTAGMQLFSAPVDGLETGAYSLLITDASGEHMQAGRFIVE